MKIDFVHSSHGPLTRNLQLKGNLTKLREMKLIDVDRGGIYGGNLVKIFGIIRNQLHTAVYCQVKIKLGPKTE